MTTDRVLPRAVSFRLLAPPEEIDHALTCLNEVFEVVNVSRPYPCHGTGGQVRVYAEVLLR